ncbi:MAG: hypothetical protein JW914_06870 [Syntrophaceae bacterium]|nr:hypothetical protein [Syntrophaceae bacterium]
MFSKKIFRKFVAVIMIIAFLSAPALLWAKDKSDDEENPPKPLLRLNLNI